MSYRTGDIVLVNIIIIVDVTRYQFSGLMEVYGKYNKESYMCRDTSGNIKLVVNITDIARFADPHEIDMFQDAKEKSHKVNSDADGVLYNSVTDPGVIEAFKKLAQ